MSREAHVRFCEGPGVQLPRSTQPYIRTHEGWLYLAVVVDLFSRQVVGWSMGSRIDTTLVLDALLMALWRRRPQSSVMLHSDQGCQFTSEDWIARLTRAASSRAMNGRTSCASTTSSPA